MVNNPPVASFSVPTGRWGRYLGIGRVFSACLQLNPCISNSCDSHSAEPSPLMAVHFRLKFDFTLQGVTSLFPFLISLPTYGVCVQSLQCVTSKTGWPTLQMESNIIFNLIWKSWTEGWGNEKLCTHWERSSTPSMGYAARSQRHNIILQKDSFDQWQNSLGPDEIILDFKHKLTVILKL